MNIISHVVFILYVSVISSDKVYCNEDISRTSTTLSNRRDIIVFNGFKDNNGEVRKQQSGQGGGFLEQLIPMLATPFLLQITFLPAMLLGIKLVLILSIFAGKLGIIFGIVNFLRNSIKDKQGQLYSHNIHVKEGW